MKTTSQTAVQFFYNNAGYCYIPEIETQEQGRRSCAQSLAEAEERACDLGYSFRWEIDGISDSSDFSNEEPAWNLWVCYMNSPQGECAGSLSGIDFGRDGEPWGNPYRRVVEAELAQENLPK